MGLKGSRAGSEGLLLAAASALCQRPAVTEITGGPSARRLAAPHPPGLWSFARLVARGSQARILSFKH